MINHTGAALDFFMATREFSEEHNRVSQGPGGKLLGSMVSGTTSVPQWCPSRFKRAHKRRMIVIAEKREEEEHKKWFDAGRLKITKAWREKRLAREGTEVEAAESGGKNACPETPGGSPALEVMVRQLLSTSERSLVILSSTSNSKHRDAWA